MSPCATTFLAQRSDQVTAGPHVWGCWAQVESPWNSSCIFYLAIWVGNVLLDGKWQIHINESTVSDTNDTNSVWQLLFVSHPVSRWEWTLLQEWNLGVRMTSPTMVRESVSKDSVISYPSCIHVFDFLPAKYWKWKTVENCSAKGMMAQL